MELHNIISKKWIVVFLTALVGLAAGIHFFRGSQRGPAAINRQGLFENQKPEDSRMFAKELLSGAEIQVGESESLVVLNLAPRICNTFDRIEIRFEAEGIATNGARPALLVDGPCGFSESNGKPMGFYIPVENLKNQKVSSGVEFNFLNRPDHFYKTENFEGQWPEHWVLTEIRGYKKSASGLEFRIERKDVYTFSSRPLQMIW